MEQTKQYIQSLYKDQDELLTEMEQYAANQQVPIMEKDGIEFLKQIIRIHRPKKIIEIGAAIGYSAIQMAKSDSNVIIQTVERDEKRYHDAISFVKKANLDHRIEVNYNDAVVWLEETKPSSVDLVFIDAAKGEYQKYVEVVHPFLKSGGLIIVDNVLFKGYVSKAVQENKRWVKIGEKIATFNEWLFSHPQYETTMIETGDGIAIALKK
ncbi:O-methyltransferase [Alkalibacillus aidingensis]|uniref:O-methyltransferase n=1 Tax=Alkalibacillus aidingensis TaxID=2747607 RepID=UPI0016602BBE|nr:O-methyltransferase [Alkalibacillus aidingensis]